MKKASVSLIFACISFNLLGQMNIDSLLNVLENSNHFSKTSHIKYLIDSFQRYENKNVNEHYDVFYDSTGKLSEYCGQTVVHRTFDSLNRITSRIGYKPDGNHRYFDYDPIIIYKYYYDTTIVEYYGPNFSFRRKVTEIRDTNGRVIEERLTNQHWQLIEKTIRIYSDTSNEFYVYLLDSLDNFRINKFGVSIIREVYDSTDHSFIIEQEYLDSNFKQVDANHDGLWNEISYSKKINTGTPESGNEYNYINSKGEIVLQLDWWFNEE